MDPGVPKTYGSYGYGSGYGSRFATLPKTMKIHADLDPPPWVQVRYGTFQSVQPQCRGCRAVSWTRESAEVQVFPPSAVRSTRIIRRPPPDHAYPSHIRGSSSVNYRYSRTYFFFTIYDSCYTKTIFGWKTQGVTATFIVLT